MSYSIANPFCTFSIHCVVKHVFALITHLLSIQTTKSWKMLMNNQFKAQSLNRKSHRKFTLSYFSLTCFKHVGLLWPISALDRKQVRGYVKNVFGDFSLFLGAFVPNPSGQICFHFLPLALMVLLVERIVTNQKNIDNIRHTQTSVQ